MKQSIKDFCKQIGITENQFNGKEKIGGYLNLSSLTSIPEGFNPTVGGYLDLRSITSIPEGFNPTVGGDLYLSSLTSIPEGFNPTVGGSLYLSRLTSIPEGFNPTVGGYLDLSSLTSIPEGFNPTVGGSLYLSSLTSIPEGFNPTVGGSLYLSRLTSIPEGFNPTVGGYLYLSRLTSIPEGFNPTVGGDLDLNSLTSIPEGFNPTVGGYLDLSSLTSIPEGFNPTVGGSLYLRYGLNANSSHLNNKILSWANGKYISADGIFTEVLSKKRNIYKVKKLNDPKEFYLVSDGQSFHAHGDTLKQAKEDLRFKMIADKLKKEPIKKDTIITVQYYRIITGACETGVKNWMKENNIKKTQYKASELLPLLEKTNAYGVHRFKELLNF